MKYEAILHIPMSQYAFGLDETHVVYRLRAARGDLKSCTLIYGDRSCRRTPVDYFYAEMEKVCQDNLFDWWEVTLETHIKRLCYGFRLVDQTDESTLYYGDQFNDELTIDRSEYFQLPYNHRADRADVPAWMQDAIVYNIFPDSFATAKGMITDQPTEFTWNGEIVRGKLGGTIRGIMENLPYIRDMGFNCIYMNPIFVAGEYHKYDLIDYFHIDPAFGTDMVMRWTPATTQKEVQNMNYNELKQLVAGKDPPCGGTNDEGETVIIEHEKNDGDPRFHLTTVQNNGWLRHNYIYEDGSREELFEK